LKLICSFRLWLVKRPAGNNEANSKKLTNKRTSERKKTFTCQQPLKKTSSWNKQVVEPLKTLPDASPPSEGNLLNVPILAYPCGNSVTFVSTSTSSQ